MQNKAATQVTNEFYSNRALSYEELENPMLVIDRLFDFGKLQEIRELLWLSFRATIIGDYPKKLDWKQRNDIVSIYEFIEKLVEAAHLIHIEKKVAPAKTAPATISEEPVFYPYLPEHINKDIIESYCPAEKPNEANPLLKVVESVIGFTNAEKIFLVNGNKLANGSQQFNLLVILPDRSNLTYLQCQHLIQSRCSEWAQTLAWCNRWSLVKRALEEGHIFYSAVCTPDKLLYSNSPLHLPKREVNMRAIKEKAEIKFNQLYEMSTSFLDGARYYITTHQYPTAAFMLHQGMELGLRGLIYSLTDHYKYGHNIETLLRLCSYCAPKIESYFLQNSPDEVELFELLKGAYVHPRYAPDYHISEDKLLQLMERVDSLHSDLPQFFDENIIWFEEMMELTAEHNSPSVS